MLMLAREGEWSQVIELELKRKESLNSFFAVFHGVEIERDIVKATLEQVQESDRQLLALAKNAQQDIATALSMLGRSRQCIEQYHQNQDLP